MGISYLVILGFSQMFMCVELTTVGALSGLGKNAALFCDQRCIHLGENTAGHDFEQFAAGFGDGIWWAFTISSDERDSFLSVFLYVSESFRRMAHWRHGEGFRGELQMKKPMTQEERFVQMIETPVSR